MVRRSLSRRTYEDYFGPIFDRPVYKKGYKYKYDFIYYTNKYI